MAPTLRVGIVDDHAFVRASSQHMFKLDHRLIGVAEAKDASGAIAMPEKHRPNVVIIDINMPVLNVIEATRIIRSKFPGTRVLDTMERSG